MYEVFEERDVEIVGISIDDLDQTAAMADLIGRRFPVLSDPHHIAADAYDVFDLLGDGVATPSTFIIDDRGRLVWAYVGQDIGDRPTAYEILVVLEELFSFGVAA